jgi:hypothetical protein
MSNLRAQVDDFFTTKQETGFDDQDEEDQEYI